MKIISSLLFEIPGVPMLEDLQPDKQKQPSVYEVMASNGGYIVE